MAKPNPQLISAIERTVLKLQTGAPYEWGHMGACNCGNLAQELTKLTKGEIHQYAMQRHGDWNEQLIDYCPTSGYPMDLMISKMIDAGLSIDDLAHLERLSDQTILRQIPKERRDKMNQNSREDVILYMQTWANLLREKWIENQEISDALRVEKKLNQPALV
ncbi:hypothetical protein [Algoriphagus sanaruensis]|uniref:Uncharacterized protein n=1 Tax=Algoriphagus sanaruensis TaxID=1727163 RepID=A0A142EP48_9BACT|nr:hypothetical protein [Algoriphagus sanaruensis]AMQ56903.1 hypothetical protein AO498_10720 [Algoriphagus sanaruensis]